MARESTNSGRGIEKFDPKSLKKFAKNFAKNIANMLAIKIGTW